MTGSADVDVLARATAQEGSSDRYSPAKADVLARVRALMLKGCPDRHAMAQPMFMYLHESGYRC